MTEELETPVTARNRVRSVGSQIVLAEQALKAARDVEVRTKHEYESARRRALLSPEAPKVSRGTVLAADREAWVDDRCADIEFAFRVAEANRMAAKDHFDTLETQAMLAQALLKSIDRAFSTGTRDE